MAKANATRNSSMPPANATAMIFHVFQLSMPLLGYGRCARASAVLRSYQGAAPFKMNGLRRSICPTRLL